MKLPFENLNHEKKGVNVTKDNLHGTNVFFGTGLVSGRGITNGIPLDFLEFLNSARQMRSLMNGKIIHILADSIAEEVTPTDKHDELKQAIEKCEDDFLNLYQKLGLQDQVIFIKSSQIEQDEHYQSIFTNIDTEKLGVPDTAETYVKSQLALMEFMRTEMDCSTKISWAIDLTADEKRDEDFFDRFYEKQFGRNKLIFYYGKAGQSLDGQRPRMPPYIMLPDEREYRLALDSSEDEIDAFFEKMDTMTGRSARKRVREMEGKLSRVIASHEAFSGNLDGNSSLEKTKDSISKINGLGFPETDPQKLVIIINPDAYPAPHNR